MKKLLIFAMLLLPGRLSAQSLGALAPDIMPVFVNTNGVTPVALGFVCTTASGGTTPQLTYQDAALMTANQDPVRLNASGRAVNGSTLVAIYLNAATPSYRFTLYAAGTGNTCNGVTVGSLIWQQDNVQDLAQILFAGGITINATTINNQVMCDQSAGGDSFAKINACVASVVSQGGGVANALGFVGAQTGSTQITINNGTTPVMLWLGATFTTTKRILIEGSNVSIMGFGVGVIKAATTIAYADDDLILVASGGSYPSPGAAVSNVTITGLTIDGNQQNVSAGRPYANDTHGNGINLNRCQDCKVIRNTVKNIVYQAIVHTGNSAGDANDGEIASNIVDSFGEIGVGVENHSYRWNVHGNTVRNGLVLAEGPNGPNAGIYVGCNGCSGTRDYDNKVVNNQITAVYTSGSGNKGIMIDEFGDRTLVDGNTITTAAPCIRVQYTTAASIASNGTISNNKCYDNQNTGVGGIDISAAQASPSTGWTINGNTIRASQGGGVSLTNVTHSGVTSNSCISAGLGAGAEQNCFAVYAGAAGTSALDRFIGNEGSTAAGNGMHVGANVQDSTVAFNQFYNNTSTNISDSGTRTMIGCNKTENSDSTCAFAGTLEAGSFSLDSGGTYAANQSAVRTWTLAATGGNWNIASGDNLGAFSIAGIAGGLILPSVTFANAGTCSAPNTGRQLVITDSNTVTWGATIAGMSTNAVEAWCNGSNWTVVGK